MLPSDRPRVWERGLPGLLGGFPSEWASVSDLQAWKGQETNTLIRVKVLESCTRHVFGEAHGFVTNADSMLDDVLQLILSMSRAKLPGMRMHGEGHVLIVVRNGLALNGWLVRALTPADTIQSSGKSFLHILLHVLPKFQPGKYVLFYGLHTSVGCI